MLTGQWKTHCWECALAALARGPGHTRQYPVTPDYRPTFGDGRTPGGDREPPQKLQLTLEDMKNEVAQLSDCRRASGRDANGGSAERCGAERGPHPRQRPRDHVSIVGVLKGEWIRHLTP